MPKCVYEDDLGRCRKNGKGDPPLCSEHEKSDIEIYEIVDAVLAHPAGSRIVKKINDVLDGAAGFIDKLKQGQMPFSGTPKPKIVVRKRNPREVLHFGPNEPLDEKKINERRNALAHMAHPDKGGSKEAMAEILEAAKELKNTLKEG